MVNVRLKIRNDYAQSPHGRFSAAAQGEAIMLATLFAWRIPLTATPAVTPTVTPAITMTIRHLS